MNSSIKSSIRIWLLIGIVMVFFQIIIGGVTRLTGSGLSITKWDIVTGVLPPLSQESWQAEFDLYKQTPQYEKINDGMSLTKFKSIYFWEYFHRLWARTLGFVFLIPFIFFLSKSWIKPELLRSLIALVSLGGMVAVFGWIMVKSGLVDYPWVSAYKLAAHLLLALMVYSYLLNIYLEYIRRTSYYVSTSLNSTINIFILILFIQISFGAFMSGMHAGLLYPTWPKIGDYWLPSSLFHWSNYTQEGFWNYDNNIFIKTLVHFIHRGTAYLILIFGFFILYRTRKVSQNLVLIQESYLLISVLIIQVILGIITILSCKGSIPVFLGSLHQAVAILLLTIAWRYRKLVSRY